MACYTQSKKALVFYNGLATFPPLLLQILLICTVQGPVAQLDRAFDYESKGRAFESLRVRHPTFFELHVAYASKILEAIRAKSFILSFSVG